MLDTFYIMNNLQFPVDKMKLITTSTHIIFLKDNYNRQNIQKCLKLLKILKW